MIECYVKDIGLHVALSRYHGILLLCSLWIEPLKFLKDLTYWWVELALRRLSEI